MSTVTSKTTLWETLDEKWMPNFDGSKAISPSPFSQVERDQSCISAAQQTTKFQLSAHRPTLPFPKHYMFDLLKLHTKLEEAVTKELSLLKTQSKLDFAEMEGLEKEKKEMLQKDAEEVASGNHWSVFRNVAQYLAIGTSFTTGLSLGFTPWGTLLLASGIVGLSNRVVSDTLGWQRIVSYFTKSIETQKKLTRQIELGLLYVELGTGLCGGFWAASRNAFTSALDAPSRANVAKKASLALPIASGMMQATSQVGKSFSDKRQSDLQARLKLLDARAERIRMEITSEISDARNMLDTAKGMGQEIQKAIAASELQDL